MPAHTHTYIGIVPIKVSVLTRARVKGSYETPNLDAGTQSWVLRNSSANFSLITISSPPEKNNFGCEQNLIKLR